jgi:hypothetical protein
MEAIVLTRLVIRIRGIGVFVILFIPLYDFERNRFAFIFGGLRSCLRMGIANILRPSPSGRRVFPEKEYSPEYHNRND